MTAVAVHGGDHWGPNEPKHDPICEILECLRRHGAISTELVRRLKSLGIDIDRVLGCFETKCRGTPNALEAREKRSGRVAVNPALAAFTPEQINALTAEVLKTLRGD